MSAAKLTRPARTPSTAPGRTRRAAANRVDTRSSGPAGERTRRRSAPRRGGGSSTLVVAVLVAAAAGAGAGAVAFLASREPAPGGEGVVTTPGVTTTYDGALPVASTGEGVARPVEPSSHPADGAIAAAPGAEVQGARSCEAEGTSVQERPTAPTSPAPAAALDSTPEEAPATTPEPAPEPAPATSREPARTPASPAAARTEQPAPSPTHTPLANEEAEDDVGEEPGPTPSPTDDDGGDAVLRAALGELLHVQHSVREGVVDVTYPFDMDAERLDFDLRGFDKAEINQVHGAGGHGGGVDLELGAGSRGTGRMQHQLELDGDCEVEVNVWTAHSGGRSQFFLVLGKVGVRWGEQLVKFGRSGPRPLGPEPDRMSFREERDVSIRLVRKGDELTVFMNGRQVARKAFSAKDLDGRVSLIVSDVRLVITSLRIRGQVDATKL